MKEIINIPNDSNFHLNYMYNNVKTEWEFKGYRCVKCEKTVKAFGNLERHANNCKKRNAKIYKVDPEPVFVNDVNGRPWKAFDSNQS